jgi:hypothetical protein
MTDPIPHRPPLWEVMCDASFNLDSETRITPPMTKRDRLSCAAELRALKEWLVSEPDADCIVPDHGRYLSELLLDEADRAEAGE